MTNAGIFSMIFAGCFLISEGGSFTRGKVPKTDKLSINSYSGDVSTPLYRFLNSNDTEFTIGLEFSIPHVFGMGSYSDVFATIVPCDPICMVYDFSCFYCSTIFSFRYKAMETDPFSAVWFFANDYLSPDIPIGLIMPTGGRHNDAVFSVNNDIQGFSLFSHSGPINTAYIQSKEV